MKTTRDLSLLELGEAIAAIGFLGGVAGYVLAAIIELAGTEIDASRAFLTGSALAGLGAITYLAAERLA